MKQRKIKETISQEFLLSLLEPYHPPIKAGEKILRFDLSFDIMKDAYVITYIIQEGGVNNSSSK